MYMRVNYVSAFMTWAIACVSIGLSVHASGTTDDWRDPQLKNIDADVPPYEGPYYRKEIPDTLELTDRAALAINAVTRMLNPEYDHTQYSYADLTCPPETNPDLC